MLRTSRVFVTPCCSSAPSPLAIRGESLLDRLVERATSSAAEFPHSRTAQVMHIIEQRDHVLYFKLCTLDPWMLCGGLRKRNTSSLNEKSRLRTCPHLPGGKSERLLPGIVMLGFSQRLKFILHNLPTVQTIVRSDNNMAFPGSGTPDCNPKPWFIQTLFFTLLKDSSWSILFLRL